MADLTLTDHQARRFLLAHQGLRPPRTLDAEPGILDHIRRVGCIQYDPLNIVGRNPDLVLQARINDFRPEMLEALLYRERQLLDGWDKNMAIYAVEDWPYFRRYRQAARRRYGDGDRPVAAVLPQVRQAIEELGPLSSIDLDLDRKVDWSWAPTRLARAALDSMWSWGELVIHHKVNTRKVYDFAHRHLPEALLAAADPNDGDEAFHDWFVLRRIGGVGLLWNRAGDAWLGNQRIKSKQRSAAIERLLAAGRVKAVQVDGLDLPLYMRSQDEPALDNVLAEDHQPPQAAILAPLDNLLWDRRLIAALFGFEYIWEVYKPAAERQYGYYVLPILYGDQFVARFEPVRDKESGALIIKGWWWEPDIIPSPEMRQALNVCVREFMAYLGTDQLHIANATAETAGLGWLEAAAAG